MCDLEDVRAEHGRAVLEEPPLLGFFGVAHDEHSDVAGLNERNDARKIGIGERRRPRRIRREKRDRHAVDLVVIAGVRARPANA